MAALLGLCIAAAQAVSISPVLVELSPARRIASITFSNPGNSPLRYQSQVLAWTQVEGKDQRVPSEALIVAPPIADIAPGATQIFRVALRGAPTGQEQAFRLIFEDASPEPAAVPGEVGLRLHINHDLPVFVEGAGAPMPDLQLGPCPGRPACVRASNRGARYAQVRGLVLDAGNWHKQVALNDRVLAGAWREWPLDVPASARNGARLRVSAYTLSGQVSTELPTLAP